MATVTVIVPVYRSEKYLRKCVDSILKQSFSDLELILVDDGSPDASGTICDEYAASDLRIKVIHKENGGVSSARNAALKKCESQYVTFCDADDYWEPDWVGNLYDKIVATDADVVSADIKFVTDESVFIKSTDYKKGSFIIQGETERIEFLVHQILEYRLGWSVCTRLFKTDIIKKNNIWFCESCEDYAEDLCFTLEYSLYCNRIETCDFDGYCYVQHQESMMANSMETFKLNAVNEVSRQFGERFLSLMGSDESRSVFPVIHYLIFRPEYNKILREGEIAPLRADVDEIEEYAWYRTWTFKVFTSTAVFRCYLGKGKTKEAVRSALLCLYHLWKPYELYRKGKATIGRVRAWVR